MPSQMGKTDGVGVIVYTGTRDDLCAKLKERDDRITDLERTISDALDYLENDDPEGARRRLRRN